MTIRLVFWFSFALIAYAYLGYPLLLCLFARRKPVLKAPCTPSVSIVIAVRNEEFTLPAKLDNLAQLDYPVNLIQILIVSDGSTDDTAAVLERHAVGRGCAPGLVGIVLDQSAGKANALNQAVRRAQGEILVFLDARQSLAPSALSALVSCFADASVGAVSGELLLESPAAPQAAGGVGIYWKIEKLVRKLESASGSVIGVTGAIYAIRRELYTEIPPGTILDDVFVPMQVARKGMRVIFEPKAIARDRIFAARGKEFARKVRTLTGNYQLVRLAPWLLTPSNPLLFRFISHKLARLLVPVLLVVALLCSALAGGALYKSLFCLQLIFYAAALLGVSLPSAQRIKPVGIAAAFAMLNAAAAVALYNFITGRYEVWA